MTTEPSPNSRIGLFEDDGALAAEIVAALAQEDLAVRRIADEPALLDALACRSIDILVLDRMVRGRDSLDLLVRSRAAGDRTPVLVISSLASVDERIRGLKAGGDDYLVKPFALGELIARVMALRRRAESEPRTTLEAGPLSIDRIARSVTRRGVPIALLPREFALLDYLVRHAGEVVTRSMLLEDVWQYNSSAHTNVVDVHIGTLRKKIEEDGCDKLIVNVRGIGFKFDASGG